MSVREALEAARARLAPDAILCNDEPLVDLIDAALRELDRVAAALRELDEKKPVFVGCVYYPGDQLGWCRTHNMNHGHGTQIAQAQADAALREKNAEIARLRREVDEATRLHFAAHQRAEATETRVRELEQILVAVRDCTDIAGWGSTVAASDLCDQIYDACAAIDAARKP